MGKNFEDYGNAELLQEQLEEMESRLTGVIDEAIAEGILLPSIVVALGKAQAALTLAAAGRIAEAVLESRGNQNDT